MCAYRSGWSCHLNRGTNLLLTTTRLPQVGFLSALPFNLILPPVSVEVQYTQTTVSNKPPISVLTVDLEGAENGLMIQTNARTNVSFIATAHADPALATCQSSACYSAAAPRQACVPCAVGELLHSLSGSTRTDLDVTLNILGGAGQGRRLQGSEAVQGALRVGLSLFATGETARDNDAAFVDRSKITEVRETLLSQVCARSNLLSHRLSYVVRAA